MRKAESLHRAALTAREALLFEAGVKLGGIFHQYLGVPVGPRTARSLERTIAAAVGLQPFVRRVRVRVDPERAGPVGAPPFDYRYLTAEMLDVTVELADGEAAVSARLSFRPELRYPLMRVERATPPLNSSVRSARRRGRSARRRAPWGGSGEDRRTPRGRATSSRSRGWTRRSG